jgi:hypothetical protein
VLQQYVVEARTKRLGEDHLDTLEAVSCLAITYRSQGNHEMCERLQKQVLEERSRQLGEDHPGVQRAMVTLAKTYGLQGRYATAEELLRRVVYRRVMDFGITHVDTIASLEVLQAMYEAQGDLTNALKLVGSMVIALEAEGESHEAEAKGNIHLWERKLIRLANEHEEHGLPLQDHILEKVGFF